MCGNIPELSQNNGITSHPNNSNNLGINLLPEACTASTTTVYCLPKEQDCFVIDSMDEMTALQ